MAYVGVMFNLKISSSIMKCNFATTKFNQRNDDDRCFEQLRKSIVLATLRPKVILIASSLEQEGSSTIACRLAIALAKEKEKKILLVDANLRHPEMHLFVDASDNDGLIEWINGSSKLNDVIRTTRQDNIFVMTSGNVKNELSQIFDKERLRDRLDLLRDTADYVIIDGAPLGKFPDSYFLAEVADAVALVVHAGHTRWEVVKEVKQRLEEEVNANILGVILNRVTNPIPDFIYRRM